ncbi:MAG: putative phosphohydrolase [Thermoleophilia bacterium]|nr:putative phosphohydrolase [Thermoleophilia bacterium]
MPATTHRRRVIAHLSDLHCGHPHFVEEMLVQAIDEVNELDPDVVVISGDLTGFGFLQDYEQAKEHIDRIKCENLVVIPGNHDARNVGYLHFEDLFGPRNRVLHTDGMSIVAVDSTEPDLNEGKVGRGRYGWIRKQFSHPAELRIFVLHHHLVPIPRTGRERSMVTDSGDVLELLTECGVDLVLSGHKHVPYAWQLEEMFVVNAGTVSTTRLRGRVRPSYNVIEFTPDLVTIDQKIPGGGRERVISFDPSSREYRKYVSAASGWAPPGDDVKVVDTDTAQSSNAAGVGTGGANPVEDAARGVETGDSSEG